MNGQALAPPEPERLLADPIEETKELRILSGEPAVGSFGTAQVHATGMGGINAVAIVAGAAPAGRAER